MVEDRQLNGTSLARNLHIGQEGMDRRYEEKADGVRRFTTRSMCDGRRTGRVDLRKKILRWPMLVMMPQKKSKSVPVK